MRVPLVDLARLHAPLRAELDRAWARVVDSGHFVLGPEVEAFERELATFCGVAFAVGTSSGTDALLTILLALGIGPGHEVVTSAFSFVAAAEAIARVGATPVFADVGDDFNVAPASALARIGPRTRAILFVDLFGRRADVAALARADVALVEDAAQAIGAPGVGADVSAAATSFFPTKNLGALGDGGAILTANEALAAESKLLRAHGGKPKYVHHRVGGNMRLDAVQAALLRVKLTHTARWNAKRRALAEQYRLALANVAGVALPADAPGHVWHQLVIRVAPSRDGERSARRDALRRHLAVRDVETEVYYPLALHLQPCFASLGGHRGDFPIAEAATQEALALPIHPALDTVEIAYVIDSVRSFTG